VAGGVDEINDVIAEGRFQVDVVEGATAVEDIGHGGDGLDGSGGFGADHAIQNEALFHDRRVVEDELEEEAIELGFGEWVGALLFDGVLGREYEEGRGQRVGGIADGDLALLHGFEECALDFGGGAIHLVGEDDVGENGTFAWGEVAAMGVVDQGTDDVAGEEVGRELDAVEGRVEASRDGDDAESFAKSGDAFDEDVVAGDEGGEESVEQLLLAHDDARKLLANGVYPRQIGRLGRSCGHEDRVSNNVIGCLPCARSFFYAFQLERWLRPTIRRCRYGEVARRDLKGRLPRR